MDMYSLARSAMAAMKKKIEYRKQVGPIHVCSHSFQRWHDQKKCEFAQKHISRDHCVFCTSDGCCDYHPDEAA